MAQSASFDLMTESQMYVRALASTRLPLLALTVRQFNFPSFPLFFCFFYLILFFRFFPFLLFFFHNNFLSLSTFIFFHIFVSLSVLTRIFFFYVFFSTRKFPPLSIFPPFFFFVWPLFFLFFSCSFSTASPHFSSFFSISFFFSSYGIVPFHFHLIYTVHRTCLLYL